MTCDASFAAAPSAPVGPDASGEPDGEYAGPAGAACPWSAGPAGAGGALLVAAGVDGRQVGGAGGENHDGCAWGVWSFSGAVVPGAELAWAGASVCVADAEAPVSDGAWGVTDDAEADASTVGA